jgi:hypothetical protein
VKCSESWDNQRVVTSFINKLDIIFAMFSHWGGFKVFLIVENRQSVLTHRKRLSLEDVMLTERRLNRVYLASEEEQQAY